VGEDWWVSGRVDSWPGLSR